MTRKQSFEQSRYLRSRCGAESWIYSHSDRDVQTVRQEFTIGDICFGIMEAIIPSVIWLGFLTLIVIWNP